MLNKVELQRFLFSDTPNRVDLLKYMSLSKNIKKVRVYRNHSFELVAKAMTAYLDYADLSVEFLYSDYDDSFSFFDFENNADAILIWLDTERYKTIDVKAFIENRLNDLRKKTSKPILVGYCGKPLNLSITGVIFFNVEEILKEVPSDKLYDLRMEPFSGTRLSNISCLKLSEIIGLIYIPAIIKPNMKAIFVDLDNTLYNGVLGENGINGINLTDSHKQLQSYLKELSSKGFFLCVVSKNNQQDVERMFEERKDFPLRLNDFTKITASWQPKSQMIQETLNFLNIGSDSCLFIDDNIGEISEVSTSIPEINYIHADADAKKTLKIITKFPGFYKSICRKEDNLRKDDVKANAERLKIQQNMSHEEFLKQLQMQVRIICNDYKGIERIAQLSGKTNQFIFTYQRYTVDDVISIMNNPNKVVVSFHLKDNLSDSGMIGALILAKDGDIAIVEECFVSCRALGRGIDDLIILNAIKEGLNKLQTTKLKVNFVLGERNEPARLFVEKFLKQYSLGAEFIEPKETSLVKFIYGEE